MHIAAVSECSCLIQLGNDISPTTSAKVGQLTARIQQYLGTALIDIVPSYNSILLTLDVSMLTVSACCEQLPSALLQPFKTGTSTQAQRFEIASYYGDDVALDMAEVSLQTGLSKEKIIQLHSQTIYRVYAIGFAPGFCFLGELDPRLQVPRKATPRAQVPAGSVAIAEQQTAVYPCSTPGGWHIIGRSSQDMLSLCSATESPLCVGDEVCFIAVDRCEYQARGGLL
ncbi:MAG: 5-oxoprolinase subunit PxpB [Oceanococcus sp.]